MSEAPTSRGDEIGTALYVYGVVPPSTSADLFAGVEGIDSHGLVQLVEAGELAAITSSVPLDEFDEAPLERNVRDPGWLEEKVRAHDRVLEAALAGGTVLPFRFGTIYRGEEHVRKVLSERPDLAKTLARLNGTVEFGVKAFLDLGAMRVRLLAEQGLQDDSPSTGRAYMQRRQLDRRVEEEVRTLAADWAHESHLCLAAAAVDGRMNQLPRPELSGDDREAVLNGAYLVRSEETEVFRRALAELEDSYADDLAFQLTGPWPPYNFAEYREEQ